MKVEIICKNYHLDENLKNLLEKKLARFDKYFDNVTAKVKLSSVGDSYNMEINIVGGSLNVRSVATSLKMNENIDIVLPKLERQILKHKDKLGSKIKKGAFESPTIYENFEEEKKPQLVKVKKFNVSVTTVENAVEEMELLAHDFYVFINGETNKVCVLYKRSDGDLGMIEPEY